MGTKHSMEFRQEAVRVALTSGLTRKQVQRLLNLSLPLGTENNDLEEFGWCSIDTGVTDSEKLHEFMTNLGNHLGEVMPSREGGQQVDILTPIVQEEARPSSLSKKFGQGAFPLHCDTAYWTTPCRYIILGCLNAGQHPAATLLLDTQILHFECDENPAIQNAVFLIRNGRKSFYGSIQSPFRRFSRVDAGCMEPQCDDGKRAMELFSLERNSQHITRLDWQVGAVAVIDNWRMLHGREECVAGEEMRRLLRVTVQ